MRVLRCSLLLSACLALGVTACASGRVRGGQGTEMGQAEEYQPEKKVDPPQGNVDRTSGPLTHPDPYPVLEVDLERKSAPPPASPEPDAEPDPKTEPQHGNQPD